MTDLKMKTNENSIKKFTKNGTDFFLCQKSEWTLNDVGLSNSELENYHTIKSISRRIEFLGIRLLKNFCFPKHEITYLKNGKPVLENSSKHISISHSKNFVAFALAESEIGIDIEECNERILKVKDRFLNETEKSFFNLNSIVELTIAWCVKEALFKLNGNDGLDFKTDLIIMNWDKASTINAKMLEDSKWKEVKLHVEKIGNLVLCFNFE
jgi:phosphopantetheinyl transferase